MPLMDLPEPLPNFVDGLLDVGDGHAIYWRSHGRVDGPVIVLLHGGPGAGHFPNCAKFFDSDVWRVVMFDQRGCGRSTPRASTQRNTLDHLVADMERLRVHLAIERWALHGVSWGTRLALAYGVAHSDRVTGFLLCAVFLARKVDIEWFLWDARRFFPDAHDTLLETVHALVGHRPANVDELLRLSAPVFKEEGAGRATLANAWDDYEWRMMSVGPMPPRPTDDAELSMLREKSLTVGIMEHHYMAHVLPHLPDIRQAVATIADLPCELVHGRHDVICPFEQAWLLADSWPAARLNTVSTEGHRLFSPGMIEATLEAATSLLEKILERLATPKPNGPYGHR